MQIERRATLDFFDATSRDTPVLDETPGSHVSALTGVIGEDLILGLFLHFWESSAPRAGHVGVLQYQCRSAGDGRKLDAWLKRVDAQDRIKELFQVEVKNWCYHSFAMLRQSLQADANVENVARVARSNWETCIAQQRNRDSLAKVKCEMRRPETATRRTPITPLLCMWAPLTPPGARQLRPFWKLNCNGHYLNGVTFFSASLYLRSIETKTLKLRMPRAEKRLQLLEELGVSRG